MSYDVSVKIALHAPAKNGELSGLKDKEIYELA
jgi:hypothetical protein